MSPFFFFCHVTATTEIYTLSLHDALPIWAGVVGEDRRGPLRDADELVSIVSNVGIPQRSEEHTSELQSLRHLVCRLLLEKKKKKLNDYSVLLQFGKPILLRHLSILHAQLL